MKIPSDMHIGNTFSHHVYGDYEIVDYRGAKNVSVKFLKSGFIAISTTVHVRNGLVRDKSYIPPQYRVGTEYDANSGRLVITSYDGVNNVGVRFIDTGCKKVVRGGYILDGTVSDYLRPTVFGIGFLGSEVKGKNKLAHKRWSHMIERCYSSNYHKKKPSYKDCTVCEEWHNYTNFLSWFEENYPDDGKEYHLDKDIKVDGNRVYSPDTCLFVSAAENSICRNGNTNKYFVLSHADYGIRYVRNLSLFARDVGANPSGFSYLTNGHKESYHGWSFIRSGYTPYF